MEITRRKPLMPVVPWLIQPQAEKKPRYGADLVSGLPGDSGNTAPAHQQGVGFNYAERFTFAEVGRFAAGRVLMRGHNYFMVMLPTHIRDTQHFWVKELLHIPPISHGSSLPATPP